MSAERILVVDDEPAICGLVSDILSDEGYRVSAAETAASARQQISRDNYDLVLLDIWMPDEDGITLLKDWKDKKTLHCPVIMMSGHGTVETAVEATRLGAYAFVEKPLTTAKLIQTIRKALHAHKKEQAASLKASVNLNYIRPLGASRVMKHLLELSQRCAQINTNLLAIGQEGSGRYTILRHIHELSQRSDKAFVMIPNDRFQLSKVDETSWARLKTELIDSIKYAQDGAIYFQNIDKINQAVQKRFIDLLKQLAALQIFKKFNVRVAVSICEDVPAGIIDTLQTTLSMTQLNIPSLREHSEDIPALVNHLIDQFCANDNYTYKKCSIAAQNAFLHYQWPHNIAELKALIQDLLVKVDADEIEVEDVKKALANKNTGQNNEAALVESLLDLPLREAREAFEKQYLIHQLKRVNGSVTRLADLVGMERTHLYRKLRALEIDSKESS